MHGKCVPVAQSDMTHVKGYYGGNVFYRYCQDANHHCCLLRACYVVGNESEKSHQMCNDFTRRTIPEFDRSGQTDILDGDKGGWAAFGKTFKNCNPFVCTNHQRDKEKAESRELYETAVASTSMVGLLEVKAV